MRSVSWSRMIFLFVHGCEEALTVPQARLFHMHSHVDQLPVWWFMHVLTGWQHEWYAREHGCFRASHSRRQSGQGSQKPTTSGHRSHCDRECREQRDVR